MGLINRISADGTVLEETVAMVENLPNRRPFHFVGKTAFYFNGCRVFIRYLNTQLALI